MNPEGRLQLPRKTELARHVTNHRPLLNIVAIYSSRLQFVGFFLCVCLRVLCGERRRARGKEAILFFSRIFVDPYLVICIPDLQIYRIHCSPVCFAYYTIAYWVWQSVLHSHSIFRLLIFYWYQFSCEKWRCVI